MCSKCINHRRNALLLVAAAVDGKPMLADEILKAGDASEIARALAEMFAYMIHEPVENVVLPGLAALRRREEAGRG